ncbi:hypothetical protein CEXT_699911, partial [Caerostris extrusa]
IKDLSIPESLFQNMKRVSQPALACESSGSWEKDENQTLSKKKHYRNDPESLVEPIQLDQQRQISQQSTSGADHNTPLKTNYFMKLLRKTVQMVQSRSESADR